MCPTRELANQVMEAIKSIISEKTNIKTLVGFNYLKIPQLTGEKP